MDVAHRMSREDRDAQITARRIAEAITAVVNETPPGAPGDTLYAAVMQYVSRDQFETTMRVLVEASRITKRNERYFPAEDGFARRSRLIAESMDITERRHGRVR